MPIEYSQRERPFELYRKGKREGTWDPDHFDYEQDRADWRAFTEDERTRFLMTCTGFYEGEENVTRTLAPYMVALDALADDAVTFDTVQQEVYLSQQVYEEAKHTDFFSRYYEEVFGHQDTETYRNDAYEEGGYNTADLFDTADELLTAARAGDDELVYTIGEAYLNYMGIVEAQLARGGYMAFDQMLEIKADELGRDRVLPGFQDAVAKIRQDETRHIENGRWVMRKLSESHPDIVTDVYEPRLIEYVRNRLANDGTPPENPFEGYNQDRIGRRSVAHLQDTVDYVGTERFDRLTDVKAFVETVRSETDEVPTEGDG